MLLLLFVIAVFVLIGGMFIYGLLLEIRSTLHCILTNLRGRRD